MNTIWFVHYFLLPYIFDIYHCFLEVLLLIYLAFPINFLISIILILSIAYEIQHSQVWLVKMLPGDFHWAGIINAKIAFCWLLHCNFYTYTAVFFSPDIFLLDSQLYKYIYEQHWLLHLNTSVFSVIILRLVYTLLYELLIRRNETKIPIRCGVLWTVTIQGLVLQPNHCICQKSFALGIPWLDSFYRTCDYELKTRRSAQERVE